MCGDLQWAERASAAGDQQPAQDNKTKKDPFEKHDDSPFFRRAN
jgi:hypothetical protein